MLDRKLIAYAFSDYLRGEPFSVDFVMYAIENDWAYDRVIEVFESSKTVSEVIDKLMD